MQFGLEFSFRSWGGSFNKTMHFDEYGVYRIHIDPTTEEVRWRSS